MLDQDPITGPDPSTLSPALLAERLASERALREQASVYEDRLRTESRLASRTLAEQMAIAHHEVHTAESQARDKAATAVDRRLEGMNEFRDQLRQQATSFLTISVFETWKEEDRRATDAIRSQIIDLQKADYTGEANRRGVYRGQGMVIAAIVGSVTMASLLLGIVVILSNLLSK